MKKTIFLALVYCSLPIIIFTLNSPQPAWGEKSTTQPTISPKKAADYIHAVIEANRTVYSEYIVERLSETIQLRATENWEKENTLPLPAQFLLKSSKITSSRGGGLNYRLMSLWPINKKNSPKTKFEREGLKQVARNPNKPFATIVKSNGKKYYQAIYPDFAVTKSCAKCHNSHAKSPKKDFKRGDVMGGILISFPLNRTNGNKSKENNALSPKVVGDYVHSILEGDRTVYAKYVVDRLQKKNIIYASENWWEENSLLLPAQFLLNASELIRNSQVGLDFKLISLWPINPNNGPKNDFEEKGLKSVANNPKPYTNSLTVNGKKFFQAVYPDQAVAPACVSCHNAHPKSPKHDFRLYDVIGGIIVTLPLN